MYLKADLHLCGLDLERLSDLPNHLRRLLDVKLEVTKKDQGRQREHLLQPPHRQRSRARQLPAGGGRRPCPVLIRDCPRSSPTTREQEPYSFDPRLAATGRCALPAGDYSVAGLEVWWR